VATNNQRFRRSQRLLSAKDFGGVFSAAEKSADKYFVILYSTRAGDSARLGFAIAKKRIALATSRNRLKRLVRESFRKHAATLPVVDLVVMANSRAASADNETLNKSLDNHWQRISRSALPD